MEQLTINGRSLWAKDSLCAPCEDSFSPVAGEQYLKKERPGLWLYVNLTDRCGAACPFCVSPRGPGAAVDPARYEQALRLCRDYVCGVSFTGGEPMLYPELLEALIGITDALLPSQTELDLVTNGTALERLPALKGVGRFSTIHISRHAAEDEANRALMRFPAAPGWEALAELLARLHDPDAVVLNCVLQKGGVSDLDGAAAYLDRAAALGIRNTSFITMFPANAYCREHYVAPDALPLISDQALAAWNRTHAGQFSVMNRMRDHTFCRCLSGDYRGTSGQTSFYLRCPGPAPAPQLCRQLVYTPENRLQDGFGPGRLSLAEL